MSKQPMQNKHLEHPEDEILTGNLSVLDWFSADSTISTKMDGAPAIVWGTNPENGKFFVCTKAAFNKKKIRLCYTEDDIFTHFGGQPRVAQILIFCLDFLPRTQQVLQGDWIGFGSGLDTFTPNTITYKFPAPVRQDIIIAPHTIYSGSDDIREMTAAPLMTKLISTKHCLFVQPEVELNPYREDLEDVCKFAKQMSTLCDFVTPNKATQIKKEINACIREQKVVNENEIAEKCDCDVNVLRLWRLISSIKDDLFMFIHETDEIECSINGVDSFHEGFVISNQFGTYKVVDRTEFSRMNFVLPKSW